MRLQYNLELLNFSPAIVFSKLPVDQKRINFDHSKLYDSLKFWL